MPNDITPTNCLKILASIPPHVFLSQIYNASTSIFLAYKLNTIVAYTGNHYMIFMRLRNGPSQPQRTWTLFNDTEKRTFKSFAEVAQYLIEANVAPTLLMFEQSPYNDSRINQNNIWVQQEDEDWLMLYLAAQEQESQIQGMMVDEAAIKEQQELLDSFKKGRPPTARRMQQEDS